MAKKIPDTASRSAYLNLVIAWDQLHGDFAKLFRDNGLTSTVFNAMRILVKGPKEGMRIGLVGDGLIQRVPDITRLLDRMERDGYVERSRDKGDRRAVVVRLTPEGRIKCEGLYADVIKMHRSQFPHMSERELLNLSKLLEKAIQG